MSIIGCNQRKSGRHNVGDLEHSVDNPTSLNYAVCTMFQPAGGVVLMCQVSTCWGCCFTSVNKAQ